MAPVAASNRPRPFLSPPTSHRLSCRMTHPLAPLLRPLRALLSFTAMSLSFSLHIAAANGSKDIVSWLLACGAPTDPIDNWGHTPW